MAAIDVDRTRPLSRIFHLQEIVFVGGEGHRGHEVASLENNLGEVLVVRKLQSVVHDLVVVYDLVGLFAGIGADDQFGAAVDDPVGQLVG